MSKITLSIGNSGIDKKYPEVLGSIIGQEKAKKSLQFYLKAHNSKSVFPTLLFAGSHGLGKTYFAKLVAKSLGRDYKEINCANMTDEKDFVKFITYDLAMEDGPITILFDEAHALSKDMTTFLLTLLNPNSKNENIIQLNPSLYLKWNMVNINVIFATTHTYQMFRPLKNRCKEVYFNLYSDQELLGILKSYLPKIHFSCNQEELAYFCRGRARDAFVLSQDIGRVIDVTEDCDFEQKDFEYLTSVLNMHPMGITDMEFNLLHVVNRYGPISATNIASKLGVEEHNVIDELEPRLRELSLIDSSSRGRVITEKGGKYILQNVCA